ncbi:MAG: DUF2235 domain-containing protein [Rhodobacter sp.]|nr:DUF2235 domain-containing protein [Rhodobacter sp.]
MRKIVLCMDGTGNEIGDTETNVLKFYRSLSQTNGQITHYILGVGAYDRQSLYARPLQKITGVLGLAFGLGLENDVLEAYRWLCRTYKSAGDHASDWKTAHPRSKTMPKFENDRIYVMGFSRGSYAARVLAGFINNFGLVAENDLHLVTAPFRAYRQINDLDKDEPANARFKALRQYGDILRPVSVPIRALCVFDTVASMIRLGWPWHNLIHHQSLFELSTHANVSENPSVRIVVHAMAVDERRSFFRVLPWDEGQCYFGSRFRREAAKRTQYLHQRWFPGYHSDIGGAEQEDETGIGKIAALWMLKTLEKAEQLADAEDNAVPQAGGGATEAVFSAGLRLRAGHERVYFRGLPYGKFSTTNPGGYAYAGPDARAPLHNSVYRGWVPRWSWFWFGFEILIKSISRRETGPPAWFRRGLVWYLPFLEPRRIPDTHEVDDSVFIRRDDPACAYAPENLNRPPPAEVSEWWNAPADTANRPDFPA